MYGELPEIEPGKRGFPVVIESSPVGPKSAVLRLPTSEELLSYLSQRKSIYHDLGRGKGRSEEIPTPKADQKLFRALRLDSSNGNGDAAVEFDDAEALYALNIITTHRVESCVRSGQTYVVTLATLFGPCVHTVRMPYQSERDEYQRNCYRTTDLPNNMEERRFPPEVPVKLYDKIITETTGYANSNGAQSTIPVVDVPPHHKRSVVISVLSALSSLDPQLGSDSDPNF